jgi:xanthine dehydrogenase accessory factor
MWRRPARPLTRGESLDIHSEIADRRAEGRAFVTAVIVRTSGSSPRDVGARMLVFPDSTISGTIGGGAFEKMVMDDCASLFTGGRRHLLKTYRFAAAGQGSTGMACGGEAEVFMELFSRPDRLVIFGGGHIGRDLVRIAAGLDFRVTVVDDRKEILSQYQGSGGAGSVETMLTDPEYKTGLPVLDENCYVVIVTRSHACDRTVLAGVIRQDLAYLGMIGSRTKIDETWSLLKAAGADESLFGKVRTPIGLDIGAEGPYEIALAIAAELVATRRKLLARGGA